MHVLFKVQVFNLAKPKPRWLQKSRSSLPSHRAGVSPHHGGCLKIHPQNGGDKGKGSEISPPLPPTRSHPLPTAAQRETNRAHPTHSSAPDGDALNKLLAVLHRRISTTRFCYVAKENMCTYMKNWRRVFRTERNTLSNNERR